MQRKVLLKIDTEGHELKVLEGFGDKLNDVDVIMLEYLCEEYFVNQMKLSDIIKLLECYGFNGMVQVNLRTYNKYPVSYDMIFYRIKN